jgi:pyrroline-5-carboxylate reductase
MDRVGILGFGVMGEAFAAALRRAHPQLPLVAFDEKAERREAARAVPGVTVAASAAELVRLGGLVILCVKPQDLEALAAALAPVASSGRFVSILAGKRIRTIGGLLGAKLVARFMPNIAAVAGRALVGVSFADGAPEPFRAECLEAAAAFGKALEIPERLMAAMTGLSGSGIAWVLAFADAMALGGVAAGFDYRTALTVATEALESAAALLKASGEHPRALVARVASPAGTTIQGLRALERGGFAAAVMEAVEAASRRATEFEG